MARKNLGAMFAPGAEEQPKPEEPVADQLKGLLAPKKRSPQPAAADRAKAVSDADSDDSPVPVTPSELQRRKPVAQKAKQDHHSAYLPPHVYKALQKESKNRGLGYTDLFMLGLSEVSKEQLKECFSVSSPAGLPEGMPGGAPARKRRAGGGGGTQIQLRMTDEQVMWLDSTYAPEVGAPNRSALVSTVYALLFKVETPHYS